MISTTTLQTLAKKATTMNTSSGWLKSPQPLDRTEVTGVLVSEDAASEAEVPFADETDLYRVTSVVNEVISRGTASLPLAELAADEHS